MVRFWGFDITIVFNVVIYITSSRLIPISVEYFDLGLFCILILLRLSTVEIRRRILGNFIVFGFYLYIVFLGVLSAAAVFGLFL